MNTEKKYMVILDSVNRTILGIAASKQNRTGRLAIQNPAIIAVSFAERMQMQLIPVFFRELTSDKNATTTMWYPCESITRTDVVVDESIIKQYETLFAPIEVPEIKVDPQTITEDN